MLEFPKKFSVSNNSDLMTIQALIQGNLNRLINRLNRLNRSKTAGASCINLATMLRLCLKNNFDQLAVANG